MTIILKLYDILRRSIVFSYKNAKELSIDSYCVIRNVLYIEEIKTV